MNQSSFHHIQLLSPNWYGVAFLGPFEADIISWDTISTPIEARCSIFPQEFLGGFFFEELLVLLSRVTKWPIWHMVTLHTCFHFENNSWWWVNRSARWAKKCSATPLWEWSCIWWNQICYILWLSSICICKEIYTWKLKNLLLILK